MTAIAITPSRVGACASLTRPGRRLGRTGTGRRADRPPAWAGVFSCGVLIGIFLLGAAEAVAGALDLGSTGDHVRVILDTSKSMCGAACGWQDPPNDPGRLAILSTLLLHDLLKPDPNKAEHPDSFAVIPFDQQKWTGEQPPVSSVTPRRATGMAARAQFIAALSAGQLPFDAMNTYYSPSLIQALNDLPPLSSTDSAAMTRTIVLITDGLSVNPGPDQTYIETRLLPELAARQTRLYVILFGPDASSRGEAFFAGIKQADEANVRSGRYSHRVFPDFFIVRTGEELPATMIKLFSEGFGYLHLPDDRKDRIGSGAVGLNLHREVGPPEAAIVALRLDPGGLSTPPPPKQTLSPPPGGTVNPQLLLEAREPGGSYALRWELKPSPGDYPLRITDGADVSVFVLRPTNLRVELREHLEHHAGIASNQTPSCFAPGSLVTMADRPCQLNFLVTAAAGTQGIPPRLTLRYWIKQPRPDGSEPWNSNDADGVGIADTHHWDDLAAGGQRYWSQTQFTKNQLPGGAAAAYTAHATVRVDLENRTVAARGADDPFEVLVYPRLGLSPQPPAIKLKHPGSGALGRQASSCASFDLTEDFGTRLESAQGNQTAQGSPGFNIRGYLRAERATIEGGALRGARFTLDGETIGFQALQSGAPLSAPVGTQAGFAWSQGKQRTLAELVNREGVGGRHELCVTLGPYADGDPLKPPAFQLQLILDHPPYDHFDVIKVLQAEVLVAKAPGVAWWSLLPFLLLAGLVLALLLVRRRYTLPRDLGYAIASVANPQQFVARRLPAAHPLRRLLSHRAQRQVVDQQGGLLGWVRPEDEALFALRPAPGITVTDCAGAPMAPTAAGLYLLEVHKPYRLGIGEEGLWLRLQFL
ncbi:hypothetical protein [uncultured Thiodictyon sp.]|uniref:hypothetical protein n=1 Tax=uncultured Thiodictyon sp. TaxID=1846217 RepID=UPI0025F5EE33|nr:hypothetical protein [uncultured Thiodictyon sp.]